MSEPRALVAIGVLMLAGAVGAALPTAGLLVVACAGGCWLGLVTFRQAGEARSERDEVE